MVKQSAREVALDILLRVEQTAAYSHLLLQQTLQKSPLDRRDKRLVTELVYGTIQYLNTIDWILHHLVKQGIDSLEPWIRQVLRIGIYQLAYLTKIPQQAAVHEMVELSKKRGHRGITGLVNGVLRSYLRQQTKLHPPIHPLTLPEKAIAYSHPEWMIERMEQAYGEETTQLALLANQMVPKVSIRVNTLKIDQVSLIQTWNEAFVGAAHSSTIAQDGIILRKGGNPAATSLFEQGYYTIQDESSMLVSQVLAPKPGMCILDACAAPGGKTTHLAARMHNQGSIIACDIHPHKLNLIRAHAKRLGIDIIQTKLADVRKLPSQSTYHAAFDAVLLDAPCSGLGVIQRKPDIKWRKKVEDIAALHFLQAEMLQAVAQLVKPGGTLVYSTCTWEPHENKEQVEHFLRCHPEFAPDGESFADLPEVVRKTAIFGEGWLQILPHHFHSDGFFIARLQRCVDSSA
jgi:16S rRNA (cytosine967-C5)-methyltransferase